MLALTDSRQVSTTALESLTRRQGALERGGTGRRWEETSEDYILVDVPNRHIKMMERRLDTG